MIVTRRPGPGLRLTIPAAAIASDAGASGLLTAFQQSGPALADDFLLVATLAALLLAGASTLGALGATTRERATELTALCGVAAGVLAAAMAVRSLPELCARTLAPLRYTLPAGAITAVAAVVIALVALAALAVTAVLVRRMSPSLLRTAPDDVSG